jgi:hypothetical protein
MKIGKYEFSSKEEAELLKKALGVGIDEDGNEYPTHQNALVELGNIALEQGTYDDEGNVVTEPILSDKYSIDVFWQEEEHPDWTPFRVEVVGEGSHSFSGWNYQEHKV